MDGWEPGRSPPATVRAVACRLLMISPATLPPAFPHPFLPLPLPSSSSQVPFPHAMPFPSLHPFLSPLPHPVPLTLYLSFPLLLYLNFPSPRVPLPTPPPPPLPSPNLYSPTPPTLPPPITLLSLPTPVALPLPCPPLLPSPSLQPSFSRVSSKHQLPQWLSSAPWAPALPAHLYGAWGCVVPALEEGRSRDPRGSRESHQQGRPPQRTQPMHTSELPRTAPQKAPECVLHHWDGSRTPPPILLPISPPVCGGVLRPSGKG